jgi:acyl-homoserine-lactone acylase
MNSIRLLLLTVTILGLFATTRSQDKKVQGSISWDEWGVPHIYAQRDEDLFYLDGWAQMTLHANLILELYGRSRGKAAEYWGSSKIAEDGIIHTLGFPEIAKQWTQQQDQDYQKLLKAYVQGLNDYASAHPEVIKATNRQILPLTVTDVNSHLCFVVFARFVGGQDLGTAMQYPGLGSNAWAVAPSRSASGNAMLVQNPHLPWFGEFLFTEAHFNKPGLNVYGSTLVGFPGIAIGFNEHLGWTHTNNTIDNADTYALELRDGGYMLDGQRMDFERRQAVIRVRDSAGQLSEQSVECLRSAHGPVVKIGAKKAIAIRMVGADRPNMGYQWWKMANAKNFADFEKALRMSQIPFWNVMYADRTGNIFYLFNGLVPKRSETSWAYWNRVIPGGKSTDIWTDVHQYDELPKLKNPRQGWLQNANDPPWTSTLPMGIDRQQFPGYMSPHFMHLRAQRSAGMLQDDASISFDELIRYKQSTGAELADRILDDLFTAIDQHGTDLSREARAVLARWDRQADTASSGMALFTRWADKMGVNNEAMFAKKWDDKQPRATPDGLANPKKAVAKLDEAAAEMKKIYGRLDIPWGEAFRLTGPQGSLAGNGADGSYGVFRVTWGESGSEKVTYASGGDSWVGIIEFGKRIRAKVLLSYGNASEENSPHRGDQLTLYSAKALRDAWFYPEDVKKHTARLESWPKDPAR